MIKSIKCDLSKLIALYFNNDELEIKSLFEVPPKEDMGDLAFPCFTFAKNLRKSPNVIAQELDIFLREQKLQNKIPDLIKEIKVIGAYVNFFFDEKKYLYNLYNLIEKSELIEPDEICLNDDRPVIIEFSSPNIAKPFHVGHAFSTVLGQSLSKLYEAKGFKVLKFNHLGDYGTQFGKLITAYSKWGDEVNLLRNPIDELLRVYIKFHEEAKINEDLNFEARIHFKNLELGNTYEKKLWEQFRELSLSEFQKVYQRLNITFDNYNGESFYSEYIPSFIEILKNKNLLIESRGASVVDLGDEMPPCIILKNDGTSIYASRDLAAALYRYQNFNFRKNIYVVGNPQSLHFKQIFEVLKKAEFDFAFSCQHVGFGLVKNKDGSTMATREGTIIKLEDLLNEAVDRTRKIIMENNKDRNSEMSAEEISDIAEKIGLGAVCFTFLKNGRDRDILFSWEEMLNIYEGDTAPYLQYTYARCRSVLNKAGYKKPDLSYLEGLLNNIPELSELEFILVKNIFAISQAVDMSVKQNEPSILAKHLCNLARMYNRFYAECPILTADENYKNLRLILCDLCADSLKFALGLLNIQTVERM